MPEITIQEGKKVNNEAFSERLNLALDELKWPQHGRIATLARTMSGNLSDSSVGKWLSGKGMPEVKRLSELSNITKKSVQWLLTGTDYEPDESEEPEKSDAFDDLYLSRAPRKITQLHALPIARLPASDVQLVALCNDGSVWQKQGIHNEAAWLPVEEIPQYGLK